MDNEKIEIRLFHLSDLPNLYEICLKTGDSGKDATKLYKDRNLLGHFYAAPYAIFEPELTFVVTLNNIPKGYILGTKNSKLFSEKCETQWLPELRKKYHLPNKEDTSADANIIRLIHKGYVIKDELKNYHAHLHIDLLPDLQKKGLGKRLIYIFIDKLKLLKVPSLHLEVGKKNKKAILFYEKVGFHKIHEYEYSIAYGMNL
ncbi:MAG: GNAT family N-acetyltransferase [Ignavibacteriae bacterium]|nr:MAG: GNAT family N-acetyltransferase [Ignavibacteriota bacterium]